MDLNIKIIVESNYKVYTYTVTELNTKLIEKFSVIDYKMPNMMVSTISQDLCKKAYEDKISAEMIADFLNSNSHNVINV